MFLHDIFYERDFIVANNFFDEFFIFRIILRQGIKVVILVC